MISAFNTIFYNPLYNALIFLIDTLPWADLGLVIIIFTIIIRLVLFPLSQKQARTQAKIKKLEPQINKIKEETKDNKQKQAEEIMFLYKKEKVNPFSGILFLFLQIPILFALYFIFLRGGLPEINIDILYSFINTPSSVNMEFLGLLDVSEKSFILAAFAGITQFIQAKLVAPNIGPRKKESSIAEDFTRSLSMQTKYIFPIIIFFIAYSLSAALAIYWTTGNLFMIGQEIYVRRKIEKEDGLQN